MPLKVYYLDDEPDLLEMFSEQFSTPEVVITTFSDPAVALAAMLASPPDVVFLDFRLPNTTGDQIAAQLDPAIPKALVTGDLTVKLQTKFDAVFEKPYPDQAIAEFIANCQPRRK